MSFVVECPACGESENLSGTQSADGITITCNACTTSWLRDSSPTASPAAAPTLHSGHARCDSSPADDSSFAMHPTDKDTPT